jgi:hypothetical protein
MGARPEHTARDATVTGVIEFALGERPTGAFTVTVLIEDVSRADAPSTIVGRSRTEIPALAADASSDAAAGLPVSVTVPADALKGIRLLNLRIHVRAGSPATEVRQESDSRELPAHVAAGVRSPARPDSATGRPDITEGDFVSTQSHPVLQGAASVRIPVLRV